MFCLIVLGSDKTTVSVATGQNEYYPLYMSLGRVFNNVQCAHRDIAALVAFLAIPKGNYHCLTISSYVFQPINVSTQAHANIWTQLAFDDSGNSSSIPASPPFSNPFTLPCLLLRLPDVLMDIYVKLYMDLILISLTIWSRWSPPALSKNGVQLVSLTPETSTICQTI